MKTECGIVIAVTTTLSPSMKQELTFHTCEKIEHLGKEPTSSIYEDLNVSLQSKELTLHSCKCGFEWSEVSIKDVQKVHSLPQELR